MEFKDVENLKQLSGFLKTSEESLNFYLESGKIIYDHSKPYDKEAFEDSCIEKFNIPKKNKKLGFRTIYNIKDESFKNLNKIIFFHLNSKYEPQDCAQGFVKGRSNVTNALMHLGKKKILNIDIKNFFESISKDKIIKVFLNLGCRESIANILAELTTLDNKLVLGFNTSPIIANLVVEDMDRKFLELSEKNQCAYSRYADDICFSSNDLLPKVVDIEKILQDEGFNLNKEKTKIMNRGCNQYVTGLTIFDENYPRIPRNTKRKIRLLLYYYKKYGIFSHIMHNYNITTDDVANDVRLFYKLEYSVMRLLYRIKGNIDYVNSVEPLLAQNYYMSYDQISSDRKIKSEILKKIKDKK